MGPTNPLVDTAVDIIVEVIEQSKSLRGPVLHGVCGCSASGKSTLATSLQDVLREGGVRAEVIGMDSYFKTNADLSDEEKRLKSEGAFNMDRPGAIRWDVLQAGIASIRDGGQLTVPVSGHPRGVKVPTTFCAEDVDVFLLEGLFVFSPDLPIVKIFDVSKIGE